MAPGRKRRSMEVTEDRQVRPRGNRTAQDVPRVEEDVGPADEEDSGSAPTTTVEAPPPPTIDRQQLRDVVKEVVAEALTSLIPGTLARDQPPAEEYQRECGVEAGATNQFPVSSLLRQKILSHKYVEMRAMLGSHELPGGGEEENHLVVTEDGRVTARTRQGAVSSVNLWTRAFIRYGMVYSSGYPEEAASLLGYMNTVLSLSGKGLAMAWRDYDESFRKARELDPASHPWDKSSAPIWMESVARGLGSVPSTSRRIFPPAPPVRQPTFRLCYDFNHAQGCQRPSCIYVHRCSRCSGGHPITRCTGNAAATRGRALPGPSGGR